MSETRPPARVDISDETSAALRHLGELMAQELPDVRPGQVWRGRWDDVTGAGVVLEVDADDFVAELAPFTVDVEYADAYTGIVNAERNPLGVDIAVFAGLTCPVPLFTLDKWLGCVEETVTADLHHLWRANMAGTPPKDSILDTGTPDVDVSDPRRDYRLALRAEMAHLQAAELTDANATPPTVDLPSRLVEASIAPSDLVTEKVTLSYARQAAEGNTAVTADLAERIAHLLGEDDPQLFQNDGPALPDALAGCLKTPRTFRVVRDIMDSENLSETAAARRIPAIVKFRQIERNANQSEHEFWQHALALLESPALP